MMRKTGPEETAATMAEMINDSEQREQHRSGEAPKKVYQSPKVVAHHVMEVVAGACSSTPGIGKSQPVQCTHTAS